MIGNQLEEGLLRDVHHVARRDGGQTMMLCAAVVWILGGTLVFAGVFGDAVAADVAGTVVLGIAAGGVGGWLQAQALARQRSADAALLLTENDVISRRSIRDARRRGDFTRWENPGTDGPVA